MLGETGELEKKGEGDGFEEEGKGIKQLTFGTHILCRITMIMNLERNCAKTRSSPVSGVLCGPSTVISKQGSLYLHRRPNAVLNK